MLLAVGIEEEHYIRFGQRHLNNGSASRMRGTPLAGAH
jgi:hypothetical protein